MADNESDIFENDMELPGYSEKPHIYITPKKQESGNPAVVPQRRNSSSEKWKKYFAIAVAVALGIIIILVCVTIVIELDETKANEENNEDDQTNTEPLAKHVIPVAVPDVMPRNCKEIKDLQPQAKSGNYLIRVEGTERILLVYCDHETADGGWTLVYSYGFTNYESFNAVSNAVTPIPNWDISNNNVKVSTMTPRSENERGAMDFSYWRAMGTEFLVKSNINNWIRCSPSGASGGNLAEWKFGNVKCEMVKVIQDCPTGNRLPDQLFLTPAAGPCLRVLYIHSGGKRYYLWEGRTNDIWPAHDPCGRGGLNHKKNIQNPYGAIFLR